MTKSLKKGDHVTVELDGAMFSGEFVRYYGDKVQIRQTEGKITGKVVPLGSIAVIAPVIPLRTQSIMRREEPKTAPALGKSQLAVLQFLSHNADASFREIAAACSVPIPRAATIVKSLVIKGQLVKSFANGRNHYEIQG